jgi:hypothetical protein
VLQNVQSGSGAHPGCYSIRNGCIFPGIKRSGRETDHLPPSNVGVKNEWSYALAASRDFVACNGATLFRS